MDAETNGLGGRHDGKCFDPNTGHVGMTSSVNFN